MTRGRLVELKARCPDLGVIRARLAGRATWEATLRQHDTYFGVPHGRLKLREVDGRAALLVYYERPDVPDVKESGVRLAPVADGPATRAVLAAALGVRAAVSKTREIWRWDGVHVHLDAVDGLGSFLEFEATIRIDDDAAPVVTRLHAMLATLGLPPASLLATSYAEMV